MEVVLALALVGLLAAAVFQFVTTGMRATGETAEHTMALSFAQEVIEYAHAVDFDALTGEGLKARIQGTYSQEGSGGIGGAGGSGASGSASAVGSGGGSATASDGGIGPATGAGGVPGTLWKQRTEGMVTFVREASASPLVPAAALPPGGAPPELAKLVTVRVSWTTRGARAGQHELVLSTCIAQVGR